MALRVLSASATPAEVAQAIARGDEAALRVKGVGPKLAKRVVTELKDKIGGLGGPGGALAAGALAAGAADAGGGASTDTADTTEAAGPGSHSRPPAAHGRGAVASGSAMASRPALVVSIVTSPVCSPAASSSYQGSGRSPKSSRT
ncbi:MAG: hypothetical protein HS111_24515 [Kofleriaceae bacterium]|nr:hypothetical protein [Kofleriaceae bacterium]